MKNIYKKLISLILLLSLITTSINVFAHDNPIYKSINREAINELSVQNLTGNPPIVNEYTKFIKIIPGKNLAFLEYDKRIELFISSGEEKPSNLQFVNNKSIYTSASHSFFVDSNGSKKRWFAYKLKNAKGAKKVIWQVSKSPFGGFLDNWKTAAGLVGSGEVDASIGEFCIDFSNLKVSHTSIQYNNSNLITGIVSSYKPIPVNQCTYYVRAVPVDSKGNAIGEPGEGIEIIYGERIINTNPNSIIQSSFEIWTPISCFGKYYGENQDRPIHRQTVGIDPRINNDRVFHFHGLDDTYNKIIFQVSTEPYKLSGGGYPNTPNLIFEKVYDLPTQVLSNEYPATVLVNFYDFAKPASKMKEGEYIKYYIRGAALKHSIEPGKYDITYSDTITIEYGYSPPVKWYSDSPYERTEELNVSKPNIKIMSYKPADWQDPNYMHYYYVFRAPKADEILCKWKNTQTGEVLYPYNIIYKSYYEALGIHSKTDYETKMIPRVLEVNTKVYFPEPKKEDEAWYEQLFDGIVDFFEDLWKAAQTVVNQVATAYDNLKTGLINCVAELCPVPELKGAFKKALEGVVNYGLMSIGIPPTLPNFDQLSQMSIDYLAKVALTEAGIPSDEITEELVSEVAKGIQNEIEKATNYADANPISAPFLKLDPDYLYCPAYVDVEIYNNTSVPSIEGSFNLNVTFEMDYYNKLDPINGLFLSVPTNFSYESGGGTQAAVNYRMHFECGLNANTINYAYGAETAVYDVFRPKIGVKVPKLAPGESRIVRVYLEPFVGTPYARYVGGDNVLSIDFENMYFNNGNKKFTHFRLCGQFPSAEQYLLQQGNMIYLDPKCDYTFKDEHKTSVYNEMQKPVNIAWSK